MENAVTPSPSLTFCFPLAFACLLASPTFADPATHGEHIMVDADKLIWKDNPTLPPGAKIAIIEGNPKEAGLFAFRLKFPAGYRIPPHEHPVTGHVTVLAGTFHIAVGERFDAASGDAVPMGGYSLMPGNTRHYAWADGETIIQIHGLGPWGIKYVNAADDPRAAVGSR
jgi:quercetin dioxygenase-like cupin family protein